jgi:hypothetical protein
MSSLYRPRRPTQDNVVSYEGIPAKILQELSPVSAVAFGEAKWTQSIAIGTQRFIENTRANLSFKRVRESHATLVNSHYTDP